MQFLHRGIELAIDKFRQDRNDVVDVAFHGGFSIRRTALQHVVRYFVFLAGMTNAKPQPQKLRAAVLDDVAQAVMAAVATALP